jgi:gamma-carbonic anhydrase
MPIIIPYKNLHPKISKTAFIAPKSTIIGDVTVGEESGIWFNCLIRGDVNPITIGKCTNIQDGSVIHVTRKTAPTFIGDYVTVGHKALLHGCTIKDYVLIGMGAIVMDKVVVEEYSMVAAGSVVTPGKIVKTGEIWAGNPARFLRLMTEEERKFLPQSAENYRIHCHEYKDIFLKK